MNDKFISYYDINREMGQIEEIGSALAQRLASLERNIVYMFSQIKACENKDDAAWIFECLDKIQSSLALIVYKEDIGIPDRLHRFMKDFDNFEQAKEYYFNVSSIIKKG